MAGRVCPKPGRPEDASEDRLPGGLGAVEASGSGTPLRVAEQSASLAGRNHIALQLEEVQRFLHDRNCFAGALGEKGTSAKAIKLSPRSSMSSVSAASVTAARASCSARFLRRQRQDPRAL